MDEIMRMVAAMGVEVYCFTVDYVSPDGENNYVCIQSLGPDLVSTAKSLMECFQEQGNEVSAIVHYPGFHTEEQLYDYAENGSPAPFRFLYIRQQ